MGTSWTGAAQDGMWYAPTNWTDGVPRAHVATYFQDGKFGTILLALAPGQAAHAGELSIVGATLTFAAGPLHLDPLSTNPPSQAQDLVISGSTLTVDPSAQVSGAGIFTLHNQARLNLQGSFRDATGDVLGTGDAVTITGIGAAWVNSVSFYLGGTDASAHLAIRHGGALKVAQVATIADGTATVTGPGSSVTAGTLEIGNGPDGALVIENGAHVSDTSGIVGDSPLAGAVVTGTGSSWSNSNGLLVGDGTGQASLTVTDGAKLGFAGGLSIGGTLILDGTAKLSGSYISLQGGSIIAEPPPGHATGPDVVLRNSLFLFGTGGGLNIAYLESLPGARLVIQGAISESPVAPEVLQIVAGTVALENSGNSISKVEINAGTLDLTATGAAGGHNIAFIGAGTLQIEAGVAIPDPITGFEYSGQTIDFAAMQLGNASSYDYVPDASGSGGSLTVTNGTESSTLHLGGYHDPNDFFFRQTSIGTGTQIYYEGPTHI